MAATIYLIAGVVLFVAGLGRLFCTSHFLRQILAVNIAGSGVFLLLVAGAKRTATVLTDSGVSLAGQAASWPDDHLPGAFLSADPVPQALVLTGIVVAVSATAVALVLYGRLDTAHVSREPTDMPHR